MTASVPSGFSREDLEKLLASAPSEDQPTETDSDTSTYGKQELTQQEVMDAAVKVVENSLEVCGDPVFHKAIVAIIIARMIEWHKDYSWKQESPEATAAWQRDAGKFQAIMDILTSVTVSNDDFIIG